MAKFEVYVISEASTERIIVEEFYAERYLTKDNEFVFKDRNARTVGSIVRTPGMSVKMKQ
ncbi:MAG: hypothetical protein ABR976_21200 [Terracidiphilus sp.]|jgi:hypothetical protein